MKRRDALGRVALIMGGALSAPTMLAFLEGCKKATDTATGMTFPFPAERQALVSEVAEIIIPKTDTPEPRMRKWVSLLKKC